jgi:hypothetical protein
MVTLRDNDDLADRIQDHEDRIRSLEQVIFEIKNLVKYAKAAVGILGLTFLEKLSELI